MFIKVIITTSIDDDWNEDNEMKIKAMNDRGDDECDDANGDDDKHYLQDSHYLNQKGKITPC